MYALLQFLSPFPLELCEIYLGYLSIKDEQKMVINHRDERK
jgi:hypothetical protein